MGMAVRWSIKLQANAHLRKTHRQPRHTTWRRPTEAAARSAAVRTATRPCQLEMLARAKAKRENSTLVLGTGLLLHRRCRRSEAKYRQTIGRNRTLYAIEYRATEVGIRHFADRSNQKTRHITVNSNNDGNKLNTHMYLCAKSPINAATSIRYSVGIILSSLAALVFLAVGAWGAIIDKEKQTAVFSLGRMLFFSPRLSANADVACATCHDPSQSYADGRTSAIGSNGKRGQRNTPSLLTTMRYTRWSWDGHNRSLEAQVIEPLFSSNEHGLTGEREALAIVRDTPELASQYAHAFGRSAPFTIDNVAAALAAYVRELGNMEAPRAVSPNRTTQIDQGRALFDGKAGCAHCHNPLRGFTDNQFHLRYQGPLEQTKATHAAANRLRLKTNSSKYQRTTSDETVADLGAFVADFDSSDIGKFRTPSLLYVARTAPYMHDGSVTSLREAIQLEWEIRTPQTSFSSAEIDALSAYLASLE
jgi:cytochrome c peroxidase